MTGGRRIVTFSLAKLQRLRASFDDLRAGRPAHPGQERACARIAAALGATAIPLLVRELASADDGRAAWAAHLLAHVAAAGARDRVIAALREPPNAARDRARDLLGEIHGTAHDATEADRARSLRRLAACLDTPAEIARAADLITHQMPPADLLDFVDEFAGDQPARAAALVDELYVRDDIDDRTRSELRLLRAALPADHGAARRSPPVRTVARTARAADGRCAAIATARRRGTRPPRFRCLWLLIDAGGALADAGYAADLSRRDIDVDVLAAMRAGGLSFARAPVREVAAQVAAAARRCIARGGTLPRDYYLGRDLLGLFDDHWTHWHPPQDDTPALLSRALELMAAGSPDRARPLLRRYVARRPDDADGRANLGVCLLACGEPAAAIRQLSRAVALAPNDAMHQWNLAAAAHRTGDTAACRDALRAYLASADVRPGASDRRRTARALLATLDRDCARPP
ncbi:MAG: hypothetical protein D6689_07275 [Deltaproteobacteria bacterium]|nr:MAG: hypothetical protein D6689_07275 [Deltaproteobacteria bacterium]